MSCSQRDDSKFYVVYVAFPTLLAVYSVALGLCVRKLVLALKTRSEVCVCIFLINCAFFSLRVTYWLDVAFNYPLQLLNFLDVWPQVIECTAGMALGVSWLLICFNFRSLFTANSRWVVYTAVGVGCAVNLLFIAFYFILYNSLDCASASVFSRVSIIVLISLSGAFTCYYGVKLVHLITSNLLESSTRNIKRLLILIAVCSTTRVAINAAAISNDDHLLPLHNFAEGSLYCVFLILDYTVSEVLLMYGITHFLTAPQEQRDVYMSFSNPSGTPMIVTSSLASTQDV
jgi:hypothetical protein